MVAASAETFGFVIHRPGDRSGLTWPQYVSFLRMLEGVAVGTPRWRVPEKTWRRIFSPTPGSSWFLMSRPAKGLNGMLKVIDRLAGDAEVKDVVNLAGLEGVGSRPAR